MAAKVNTKFVIALTVGVLVLMGGAVGVVQFAMKDGKDHVRRGEAQAAAGEHDKALDSFGRAVNKEPNNTEFLARWIAQFANVTPGSRQIYTDRFREFAIANTRMAEVKRTDVAAHRNVLEPMLSELRRGGAGAGAWQGLVQRTEASMRLFPTGNKGVDGLKRYRGIARTAMYTLGQRMTDAELTETQTDLEAALAFDPADAMAASALTDFFRYRGDNARLGNDPDGAKVFFDQAKGLIDDFVTRNPGSAVAKSAQTNIHIKLAADAASGNMSSPQFAAFLQPKLSEFLQVVEREDPAKVDLFSAIQATQLALDNRLEGAFERGIALFDKIVASRPQEPTVALSRANFLMSAGKFAEASESFGKLADAPNLPISYEGLYLFGIRDMALLRRVDALLGAWERLPADDAPARAKAFEAVKAARDLVNARQGIDELPKQLMNGKVAMAGGDMGEARKLLAQYNTQTTWRNTEAVLLLARVMEQQRLSGEARTCYLRIIEAGQANLSVYMRAANLDLELKNYQSALDLLTKAQQLSPDNKEIAQQMQRLNQLLRGEQSQDPLISRLAVAEQLANSTPPDLAGAAAKINEARPLLQDARQFLSMAQVLARMNRMGDAIETVKAGLIKFPKDEQLENLLSALTSDDPVGKTLDMIKKRDLPEADKLVQMYMVLRSVGRNDEAKAMLDAAEAKDANHAVVVSTRFEEALALKDMVKAREIAKRAKDLNLDKSSGRLYEAMLLRAEGNVKDAIPVMQAATTEDPANPVAHRMLGELHLANRDVDKGLASLDRALQIQPNEPQVIGVKMRALLLAGRPLEALNQARDALKFGIQDMDFVQLWLNLEFDHGNKDLAIDRRRRIFDTNPENTSNSVALATILLRQGQTADADVVVASLEKRPEAKTQAALLRAAVEGVRGDEAKAMELFEQSVAAMPQNELDGQLHLDFARLLTGQGKQALAARVLEKGRRYQRPETMLVDRTLGDTLFNTQQHAAALEAYTRARESVKEDANSLLLKRVIECNLRLERLDEAERLLKTVDIDKSSDVQFILLAAELASQREDDGKTRGLLEQAIRVDPRASVGYVRRADFNIGDPKFFEDAMADYKTAMDLDPRSTRARLMYAQCWARQGNAERAVAELAGGLNLDPNNGEWRIAHVNLLSNLGRPAQALDSLRDAMNSSADPRWPQMAGMLHAQQGDAKSAAEMFRRAWNAARGPITGKALCDMLLNLTPPDLVEVEKVVQAPEFMAETDGYSRLTRARWHQLSGRADMAQADVAATLGGLIKFDDLREGFIVLDELRRIWTDRATLMSKLDAMKPGAGWPSPLRLTIAMERAQLEGAKAAALAEMQALADVPEKRVAVASCSILGSQHFQDKQFELAVAAYQKGLSLDPENVELKNNLAFVLSKGLKRHREALPLAEQAAATDADNPSILDTLGTIQMELGKLEEAQTAFERARAATADPIARTMPTVHLAELKLRQRDTTPADMLLRELDDLELREPRVKAQFGEEIQRVRDLRTQVR
jgi:tetratricopeptide (TPR) repeat protein